MSRYRTPKARLQPSPARIRAASPRLNLPRRAQAPWAYGQFAMAHASSYPLATPQRGFGPKIWLRAALIVAFMMLMIVPLEAVFALSIGAVFALPLLGMTLCALFVLPTLYWLLIPCMRRAVDAERYIDQCAAAGR